jgi:hypothetical protein
MPKEKHLVVAIDKDVAGSVLNEFAKQMESSKDQENVSRFKEVLKELNISKDPATKKVSQIKKIVECLEEVSLLLEELELTDLSEKVIDILEDVAKEVKQVEKTKSSKEEIKDAWDAGVKSAKIKIMNLLK